jgi:hypothetical protein
MLFKEIIPVYTESETKLINTLKGKMYNYLNLKVGGKNNYHRVLLFKELRYN